MTCLALQEERDADVNLLLLCCWLGLSGLALDAAALTAAAEAARPLREALLKPLRALRRRAGLDYPLLKAGFLALELTCEKAAQEKLLAGLSDRSLAASALPAALLAEVNLALYLGACPPAAALASRLARFAARHPAPPSGQDG